MSQKIEMIISDKATGQQELGRIIIDYKTQWSLIKEQAEKLLTGPWLGVEVGGIEIIIPESLRYLIPDYNYPVAALNFYQGYAIFRFDKPRGQNTSKKNDPRSVLEAL